MAISKKTFLGVAREATPGTMQPTPTVFIPASTKFKNLKKRIYFQEDRNTRDGNNSVADGTRSSEGEIGGAWYMDTSPYMLLAFMGADTATQPAAGTDPTVYQHALSLTDNPLPFDIWTGYDSSTTGFGYLMAYNVVKSVKFKWQAGESAKGFEATFSTLGQPFVKSSTGFTQGPASFTPTTATTGGTVAAGTYQIYTTYVTAAGESAPSPVESLTTTGAASTITIPSPAALTGATGWYAYVTQAGEDTATRQQDTPGTIGTALTLTAPPTSTGVAVPPNLYAPIFSTLQPLPGYAPVISVSGVQSNDIDEFEIDIEQKYTLFAPSNGSASWVTAYPGERTAKFSFTARFDTDALYQKYAVDTGIDDSYTFTITGPNISHSYNQQLVLNFPIVGYDDMEHDRSKDNVQIKAKATPRPGSTVNSLFTAQVINTVPSYQM